MSHIIPEQKCPYCGCICDRTSAAFGEAEPNPGDVSVCFRCMEVSFFDSEMKQRRPLPIELKNLRRSPLWDQIEQIREAKRKAIAESN